MDDLVTQMGLMLTQLRYARRALDDIERSTSRYAGFTFAGAMQSGGAAMAPPMLDGALKVYIVNINDLAPGSSFGGFLEGLLGGVGRFFGGLLGGFAGGAVSGLMLAPTLEAAGELADRVERVLRLMGIFDKKDDDKTKKPPSSDSTLIAQIDSIREIVNVLGKALGYASSPTPGKEAGVKPEEASRWLDILRTVEVLVKDVSRVVDGLIILIPTLIGALASLIVHLKDVQVAILDLLRFLMKEILMLRGVLLFTLYDTIAGAAHLASKVMSELSGALTTILASLGDIFSTLFDAGLATLKFIGAGLKDTVDTLVKWLLGTVGVVLIALGDSRIFRVIVHVVQVLPALLPGLVQLVRNKAPGNLDELKAAAALKLEGPQLTGDKLGKLVETLPKFPDLSQKLAPDADLEGLKKKVSSAFTTVGDDLKKSFDASTKTLDSIGARLDDLKQDKGFIEGLTNQQKAIEQASARMNDALLKAENTLKAAKLGDSGLDKIAQAYEEWLGAKGMDTILTALQTHFATNDNAAPFAPPSSSAPPPINVEIKELVIDLGAKPQGGAATGPHAANDEGDYQRDDADDEFSRAQEMRDRHAYRPPGGPIALI